MARFHDPRLLFLAVSDGDPEAREQAILDHMPLARSLARRHARASESLDDLMQVATVALIGAVDRYDPARGRSFASFAVPTIAGELRRHFRDRVGAVRLPRSVTDTQRIVAAEIDQLRAENGHEPTLGEVASETRIAPSRVREALSASRATQPLPLGEDLDGDQGGVRFGVEDTGYEAAEARADLADAMGELPARERLILHLRFRDDLTQAQIAERVGVSQMHVSRLLRTTVASLREELVSDQYADASR